MTEREVIVQVTLNEDTKNILRQHFKREYGEDTMRCLLETMADNIEEEHPLRAKHIRNHMDELIQMYWKEVDYWECEALNYATMNNQGVYNQLESALEADNEWESINNGLNV